MNLNRVFVVSTAAFLFLGGSVTKAGQTINDVGYGLRERQVGCEGA
jgi:hypothetical protein